jgi:hypothetical protein
LIDRRQARDRSFAMTLGDRLIKLPKIDIKGDAYAVGRALGVQAARCLREVVFGLDGFQALLGWRDTRHLHAMAAAARRAFPRYVRELEGIADGAGVDVERLFLWNCRGDLRLPEDEAAVAEGCTTVLLPSDAAADRPAVIGHNEDGAAPLDGHCFLASVSPDDGLDYMSFCYPGMLPGHAFAVNAAGLVHTVNNIRPHDLVVGVPRHFVARAVLDCRTLDAALEVLRRDDRASGFHHGLAQVGDRRVLSVEAPASGCHVRSVGRPGDPCAILFDRSDRDLPIYRRDDNGEDDGRTLATAVFRVDAERVDWMVHGDPDGSPLHQGSVRPAA